MTQETLNFAESQSQQILAHLLAGNRLTPLEALERFGSFRLGGRIHELRQDRWNVQTKMVERNGKRFAEYFIDLTNPKLT